MDDQYFQKVANTFRMLSQPNRLKIMWLCLEQSLSVSDIMTKMKTLSQSLISHHLKLLREANLIHATRDGKRVLYHVKDECARCIIRDVIAHTKDKHKGKNNNEN